MKTPEISSNPTIKGFKKFWRIVPLLSWIGLSLLTLGLIVGGAGYLHISSSLPPVHVLKQASFQVPMKVYSKEGLFIAEFGEKRRIPLKYNDFPKTLIQAVLATEDQRFFDHGGVDLKGLLRATFVHLKTGEKSQGGSTITMQVARNFFLTRERTYIRKIREILLSWKIESNLTKEDILELYLNKIFLGHRTYGFGAAAKLYYGKPIDSLDLPQYAMLAGLPQAPSRANPLSNPEDAFERRNHVLSRMLAANYITQSAYEQAKATPLSAKYYQKDSELEAPYIAEMVRRFVINKYGDKIYSEGYKVYTSIEAKHQNAANSAVRKNLISYDQRHGYRGAESHIDLPADPIEVPAAVKKHLRKINTVGGLLPGVVTEVHEQKLTVMLASGEPIVINWEGLLWASPYKSVNHVGHKPKTASQIAKVGDIVRVLTGEEGWQLAQIPTVSGALVSLNPQTGAIISLVGGFDFYHSKFNRVTQAERQPGSNFKPFIYSAALNNGYTAASIINDAPVVFDDPVLGNSWRPENYSGKTFGPTRLREGLVYSRNLISIRLLRALEITPTIKYAERFGFSPEKLPADLSLSLGNASLTPLSIVRGFAVFANGGYLVRPHVIEKIEDSQGRLIYKPEHPTVCPQCTQSIAPEPPIAPETEAPAEERSIEEPEEDFNVEEDDIAAAEAETPEEANTVEIDEESSEEPQIAPRVISASNAYIVTSILKDVIKRGTARRARILKRNDLAGKTGTTNDQVDAWFTGYNHNLVTTAWVGFDQPQTLGKRETGGRAALPMWIRYMQLALEGAPESEVPRPSDIVSVRIDPNSGKLAQPGQKNAIFEIFASDNVPTQKHTPESSGIHSSEGHSIEAELF